MNNSRQFVIKRRKRHWYSQFFWGCKEVWGIIQDSWTLLEHKSKRTKCYCQVWEIIPSQPVQLKPDFSISLAVLILWAKIHNFSREFARSVCNDQGLISVVFCWTPLSFLTSRSCRNGLVVPLLHSPLSTVTVSEGQGYTGPTTCVTTVGSLTL